MMTGFELGPLVSEVTALPTDPQPLPKENIGNYQTVPYYLEVVLKNGFWCANRSAYRCLHF